MVAFFEAKRWGRASGPEVDFSLHHGRHVLAGTSPRLARACVGLEPHQGEVTFFGIHPSHALQQGLVTYVPHRWPDGTTTSVRRLVEGALALAGKRRGLEKALEAFGLVEHAKTSLARLSPALQRATAFACGYAVGTQALVFDNPFQQDDGSRPFAMLAERFVHAFSDRDWIAFASHVRPQAPWLDGAQVHHLHDDVLNSRRRTVHYRIETSAPAAPLVDALRAQGEHTARLDAPTRLLVDTTEHVFSCARHVGVLVVHLEAIEVESPE